MISGGKMLDPAYIGVAMIGLLHGLEPGHGWPVAVLYSMRRRNTVLGAALSSSIIGMAHLISSIAVVALYFLFQSWLDFEAPWIKYVAAALLLILAFKMFREKAGGLERQHSHLHPNQPDVEHEHEHEHPDRGRHSHRHKHVAGIALSLLGLASFAFVLGFAHEEEFALLALVAGGVNAWILMLSYGVSVLLGLLMVTIMGVKIYKRLHHKLIRYERYVPKVSAGLLVVMAIFVLL
jgi:nickel/cobalt transporter (NicO) family protein